MRLNDLMNRAAQAAKTVTTTAKAGADRTADAARAGVKTAKEQLPVVKQRAQDGVATVKNGVRAAGDAALESRVGRTVAPPARQAAHFAKDVFDTTRPLRENAAAEAKPSLVKGWLTSDSTWGQTYVADTGERRPKRFGYGEKMKTLRELKTPDLPNQPEWVKLAGARGRAMGDVNSRELSAGIGVEAEAGLLLAKDVGRLKNEAFVGVRSRSWGEAGALGQSLGNELFVGAEANSRYCYEEGPAVPRLNLEVQGRAGVMLAQQVTNDITGIGFAHSAEVGVRVRALAEFTMPVLTTSLGVVGVLSRAQGWAFAGAMQHLEASAGLKGIKLDAYGFAGAKVGGSIGNSFTFNNTEVAGLATRGEAWVGAGFRLHAGLGMDKETKTLGLELDAGAALGIGGSIGFDANIGGKPAQLVGGVIKGV